MPRIKPTDFDEAFFRKHYEDPKTRVTDSETIQNLCDFVLAYANHLGIDIDSALDMGCGVGLWKTALQKRLPDVEYTGVEYSPYVCERYGWTQGSAANYEGEVADLVICQGVLQYLPTKDARAAIETLATHTVAVLYLEALTTRDWEERCEQDVTDGDVYLRKHSWYRKLLSEHFVTCGGGVFVKRDYGVVLFDLESADP